VRCGTDKALNDVQVCTDAATNKTACTYCSRGYRSTENAAFGAAYCQACPAGQYTTQVRKTSAADGERRQVGPEVGPTAALYSCIPTGMHGPTCIFWANLTAFSRQASTGNQSFPLVCKKCRPGSETRRQSGDANDPQASHGRHSHSTLSLAVIA
jgi:hypothetical protein